MTERDKIVAQLAKEKVVETICLRMAGTHILAPDLQDLCQNTYLALLKYDAEKIEDLSKTDAIRFFIARILLNQYRSNNSVYEKTFRRFYHYNVLIGVFNDKDEYEPDERR